jgi:uroporphyrin-III C-methyltransferase
VRLDWDALARAGTTLVILMGAARARLIAERLVGGGMAADTPVAVITSATCPDQRVRRTTLAELGDEPVRNPSTIVVGAVAALDVTAVAALASVAAATHPVAHPATHPVAHPATHPGVPS